MTRDKATAAGLLLGGLALAVATLWAPGAQGGDMIAFAFISISVATVAGVLVGSAVALLVLCYLQRRPGPGAPPTSSRGAIQ